MKSEETERNDKSGNSQQKNGEQNCSSELSGKKQPWWNMFKREKWNRPEPDLVRKEEQDSSNPAKGRRWLAWSKRDKHDSPEPVPEKKVELDSSNPEKGRRWLTWGTKRDKQNSSDPVPEKKDEQDSSDPVPEKMVEQDSSNPEKGRRWLTWGTKRDKQNSSDPVPEKKDEQDSSNPDSSKTEMDKQSRWRMWWWKHDKQEQDTSVQQEGSSSKAEKNEGEPLSSLQRESGWTSYIMGAATTSKRWCMNFGSDCISYVRGANNVMNAGKESLKELLLKVTLGLGVVALLYKGPHLILESHRHRQLLNAQKEILEASKELIKTNKDLLEASKELVKTNKDLLETMRR